MLPMDFVTYVLFSTLPRLVVVFLLASQYFVKTIYLFPGLEKPWTSNEERVVAKDRRGEVEEEAAVEADQGVLQVPQVAHLQLLRQLITSPL
jgi:hypothetical protein